VADWSAEARRLRAALRSAYPAITPLPDPAEEAEPAALPSATVLRREEQRPPLFDYQRELSTRMVEVGQLRGRALLSLPTGAGKTRTAVAAILDGFSCGAFARVVWLAPTLELVLQAFSTVQQIWREHGSAPDLLLTREPEGSHPESLVWIATPQTIYALSKRRRDLGNWDLVVFDEAHQLGARTFRSAVGALMSDEATQPGSALIGLSATPGRVDPAETEDLVTLFGGELLKSQRLAPNPVQVLQRRGVLAKLRFRRLTSRTVSPDDEAQRTLVVGRACEDIVKRGRKVLVFATSVAGAVVLAEALRSKGIASSAVHSGLLPATRTDVLRSFASGETAVVTNYRVLATGYDCPAVSDAIVASPVGSPILFEQIVGRVARGPRTGGSAVATVWEFDDHLALHGLPASYYRFRDFDWS
jgi:DNA repair protein RadD